MRRLALGGLVVMVVLGLAVGGALAGEQQQTQTQQQEQAEPQNCYCNCFCDCEDCLCPDCDCPQECQQNQSGDGFFYDYEHLNFWEGPHDVPAKWQWLFGWGSE